MSNDDNWLLDMDPDYDGQGKSRQEETDGSMMVIGCLMAMLVMVFLVVSMVLIAMMIL